MTSLGYSALCMLALVGMTSPARAADSMTPTPTELENVDLQEKLGAQVPLDTTFIDPTGKTVRLADLIGDRPVILTFNYSNCPMLCSVQLTGLVDSMKKMPWSIGDEFEVITISLDPSETRERATDSHERYANRYGRTGAAAGWTFLTGTKQNVDAVANAVGFGYTYHEGRKEYLHPAVLTLLSPGASVSTYIYGVNYDSENLQDKLIIASVGETSEALTRFILSCYHYDAPTGNGVVVTDIMRYGGLIFVLGFAGSLAIWRRRRHQEGLHSEGLSSSHAHHIESKEGHV